MNTKSFKLSVTLLMTILVTTSPTYACSKWNCFIHIESPNPSGVWIAFRYAGQGIAKMIKKSMKDHNKLMLDAQNAENKKQKGMAFAKLTKEILALEKSSKDFKKKFQGADKKQIDRYLNPITDQLIRLKEALERVKKDKKIKKRKA